MGLEAAPEAGLALTRLLESSTCSAMVAISIRHMVVSTGKHVLGAGLPIAPMAHAFIMVKTPQSLLFVWKGMSGAETAVN